MALDSARYTRDALFARARELVPLLRQRAQATSAARRVPPETIAALWDAELFYLLKPKSFGGPEVRFDVTFSLASELARGDGSAAWVWAVMSVHDLFLALYPEEAQREYWAEDHTLSASSFAPNGKIEPVTGGCRLSGKWSFCSGVDHAPWMILAAFAGMVSTDPAIPDIRYLLVPKRDITVIDDWHVMGLQGTGSSSVAVEGVFVPEHRMVRGVDLANGTAPGTAVHDGPACGVKALIGSSYGAITHDKRLKS